MKDRKSVTFHVPKSLAGRIDSATAAGLFGGESLASIARKLFVEHLAKLDGQAPHAILSGDYPMTRHQLADAIERVINSRERTVHEDALLHDLVDELRRS